MDDEEEALEPALALLQVVGGGERTLLPHVAVDEAERVAEAGADQSKVHVLGHRTVRPVVEAHVPLRSNLPTNTHTRTPQITSVFH